MSAVYKVVQEDFYYFSNIVLVLSVCGFWQFDDFVVCMQQELCTFALLMPRFERYRRSLSVYYDHA